MAQRRHKDTIWQSANNMWNYKNPNGTRLKYNSHEEVLEAQENWLPRLTYLIKNKIIEPGDYIKVRWACSGPLWESLSNEVKEAATQLKVVGCLGTSAAVEVNGKTVPLHKVAKFVATKLNIKHIKPDYKKTIHVSSQKTIHQMKCDEAARFSEKREEQNVFQLLLEDPELEEVKRDAAENINVESNVEQLDKSLVYDYSEGFRNLEEGLRNVFSSASKSFSSEKMLSCYKTSLISVLDDSLVKV